MRKPLIFLIVLGLLAAGPAWAQFSIGVGRGGGGMVIQRAPQPEKPDYGKACELSSGPAAVQACAAAVNDDNKNQKAWRLLGDAHMSVGQPREALQAYETALKLKPNMPEALRGRDAAFAALSRPAPAPYAQQQPGYAAPPPQAYSAPPPAYSAPPPQAYAAPPQAAAAGPRDGEWSGKMQRQCAGGSDEGPASVIVTGDNFAGVFFSGGAGRDLNGRFAPDGGVEAAGVDATGSALQAKGRLLSATTLYAEGQAGPCRMILTLGKAGAPVTAPVSAPAPMPAVAAANPLDGEWKGTITPRGKHFVVTAKVANGKLIIDQVRGSERVKAEGTIDSGGQVALAGRAGDDAMRGGDTTLEIRGIFTGATFEGQGRLGALAATMNLTRVGGAPPPMAMAAAPAPGYAPPTAPVPAPQASAAPAPRPARKPAAPAGSNVIQQAGQPTIDTKAPVIAVPSRVETLGPVVELTGKVSDGSVIIEFTVNGQAVPVDKDGSFTVRRGVPVGSSELKLAATDEWGNAAVKTVAVTRKPGAQPEPATASAGAASLAGLGGLSPEQLRNIDFGSFNAVVIGNNAYRKVKPLDTAANDARVVADVLRDTYKFNVDLVLDGTRQQILEALYRMRAKLGEKDSLLIYYAGHGVVDKETGRGYWLPVDADPDLPTNWVPTTDLTDVIKAIQARHIMVVADSCYSGTLLRDVEANIATAQSEKTAQWIERIHGKRSRTVLTSGGVEPVMDGGGGGHSVFAKAFLDALRGNPDIMDGQALFGAIRRPIALNSAGQVPEYADIRQAGHDGGDFLFVKR
ncbi:MAG: caspase family protein [Rhodospirillales bacterium]